MRKIPVGFADKELQDLRELAKARNDKKENAGVSSKKVDGEMTDEQLHYVGLKAERAVAKLLRVGMNTDNTYDGDGGHDLMYNGLTVDVKCSQMDLKIPPGKFTADIVVLVQPYSYGVQKYAGLLWKPIEDVFVDKPAFRWRNVLVSGWIDRATFAEKHYMRSFAGNPEVEFLEATELRPMADLKEYAENHAPV